MAGESPAGGIFSIQGDGKFDGMPAHWTCYVTVDDVDKVVEKATSLGGKLLVGPVDMPSVGRFCVIADPEGAALGDISPSKQEDT